MKKDPERLCRLDYIKGNFLLRGEYYFLHERRSKFVKYKTHNSIWLLMTVVFFVFKLVMGEAASAGRPGRFLPQPLPQAALGKSQGVPRHGCARNTSPGSYPGQMAEHIAPLESEIPLTGRITFLD